MKVIGSNAYNASSKDISVASLIHHHHQNMNHRYHQFHRQSRKYQKHHAISRKYKVQIKVDKVLVEIVDRNSRKLIDQGANAGTIAHIALKGQKLIAIVKIIEVEIMKLKDRIDSINRPDMTSAEITISICHRNHVQYRLKDSHRQRVMSSKFSSISISRLQQYLISTKCKYQVHSKLDLIFTQEIDHAIKIANPVHRTHLFQ